MLFESQIEKQLVSVGFDNMNLEQKNELITTLARREGAVLSQITNEYILNHHKQLKIDMMSETCDDTITAGFKSSNGHTYRLNRDDQINLMGQLEELNFDETIADIFWRTEDLGYIDHTREEWVNKVYREAFAHKKANLFKYNDLKSKITDAKTHAEVVAIVW
ncbi:TPA: hypothetical protein QC364_000830 [Bacillus cereus]|nr:hypothetical protein [Bacillus cereus]